MKKDTANTNQFGEVNGVLSNLICVSMNPNIFYFLNSYQSSYFQIILNSKTQKREFLKKDGWLEIRVPMDSASVLERTNGKLDWYRNSMINDQVFAPERFDYLEETINYLKGYGTVYLVRLPVTEGIFQVEDQFMPDFDEKMEQLSDKYDAPYLNYRNRPHVYDYTDGNHLYKTSGAVVSAEIANWILEEQAKNKH